MKSTDTIQMNRSIFPVKKEITMNCINVLYTGSHKFFRYITTYEGKFLKHILTYLYSTKYNEIHICHLDVQTHFSYTESHKRFLIYYELQS